MVRDVDIAWLAGIVDGEGSFSSRFVPNRRFGIINHFILCNTNMDMMRRVEWILNNLGIDFILMPGRHKAKAGEKLHYKLQDRLEVLKKDHLLVFAKVMLPYLIAKRAEAEVLIHFLEVKCQVAAYQHKPSDGIVVMAMRSLKRNCGEPLPGLMKSVQRAIPSQAVPGCQSGMGAEGVETRLVSSNNNPVHERPASQCSNGVCSTAPFEMVSVYYRFWCSRSCSD